MITDMWERLVTDLYCLRQTMKEEKLMEKALVEEITKEIGSTLEATEDHTINVGPYTLARTRGASANIKADMLLERGVSPEIVDYATKRTEYFQYRIKETKEIV